MLSGCSTASHNPTPEKATAVQTPTPTPTSEPTTTSTSDRQVEKTLEYEEVTYYNATKSDIRAVNETMVHFFEKLPENKSERTATVAKVASESCALPKTNETVFTAASYAHKRGQQLYHVARLMRTNFNSRIKPVQIHNAAQTSAKIGKYTTIVGTYNDYQEAACAFDRDDPESREDFYLASAALGFELLMFQYGMYYKTAFKANRVLSHQRTYRVVQSTFGDEALGLLMSGSYWLVHGTLQAAPKFVRERADEMNVTLSEDATHLDGEETIDQFVGAEVVPQTVSNAAKRCYDKIKKRSESNDGWLGQAEEFANDVRNDLPDTEYSVSDVLESVKGVQPEELSEDQMRKVRNCIEKR